MKKIIACLLIMISVCATAAAQKPYTHTVKNGNIAAADTITMNLVNDGVVQFEYNYTEVSGTTAGKVYLEGQFLSSWVKLDSISLSDVTTIQTLRHFPAKTYYKNYRFINTNTSAATGTVLAGYLRRPDDLR